MLQSKCNLFQLKVELTSQLLQHWSQFSFMLKILYAAQEKARTFHMAPALIHTPFKIPACWSENQALHPEQGAQQEGESVLRIRSPSPSWLFSSAGLLLSETELTAYVRKHKQSFWLALAILPNPALPRMKPMPRGPLPNYLELLQSLVAKRDIHGRSVLRTATSFYF